MATLIEQFRSLTRYWWASLILGIAVFVVGILVLSFPGESYMSMAVLFAVLMFVSGIVQTAAAFTEKYMVGRGWSAILGVLDIILGIVLLCSPGISAMILPVLLGLWLMFRGVSLIGVASEMNHFNIPGMWWTIILGILLVLCSLMIFIHPIFGFQAVVLWVGVSLLMAGLAIAVFAFQLLGIKRRMKNVGA